MDAKTEILTRIRNAHQLSNMPTDVEIVRIPGSSSRKSSLSVLKTTRRLCTRPA